MRDPTVHAIDDSDWPEDWEIPTHEVALYGEKRHAHALVIPVINEGERIRGQLLRVQAANLPVDVIVADGGSTDGSLDADFVEPAGVRCVLTKTGPGKLSAQLRMAYAWCLREGYEGIVTIDGNGKDGVEAVATMVEKLEAGCDYVQGSRYLPGGQAENTPLERTIANRLIHAPLLSIAGRHLFLDTTNGFRAYSAAYLTHPEVKPFREEFQVYNLLFYLTVRAGQLGLKVDHCPVVRRYPQSGKVPTKIGGLSSKLALLGETVAAATGGYTPDDTAPSAPKWRWPFLVTLLALLPLFLSVLVAPPYSPDSWSLYELSRTIFSDFYRVDGIRSYAHDTPYSASFPPLWPALIALFDSAIGTGARTGLYLAFASFAGFALLSEAIGRRVTGAAWIGLAVALALLLGPKLVVDELAAGRTIPLQLGLYAAIILGLLRERITLAGAAALGLVTGLAILNRFDALPLPFLVSALVLWLTRRPLVALTALGTAALTVSPWIAYSLSTCGTFFATDNAGIATSLDPNAFVTDWWPQAQPSAGDDPVAWLAKVAGAVPGFVYVALSLLASPLGLAAALAGGAWGGFHFLASRRPKAGERDAPAKRGVSTLALFAALTALLMAPQLLTGYIEYRYFSALFWASGLALAAWAVTRGVTRAQRRTYARLLALAVALILVPVAGLQALTIAQDNRFDLTAWDSFEAANDVAALQGCLADEPEARVLVLGDSRFAAQAAALAGVKAMMEPRNMVEGRLSAPDARRFLAVQRVDYVLAMSEEREAYATRTFALARAENCSLQLYRPIA